MAPKDQPQGQHPATKLADDTDSKLERQNACFFAIIAILRSYEEEPVPNLSIELSLNTIISILSTVSRTALIFVASETIRQCKWIWVKRGRRKLQGLQALDDASRGAWGALVILFTAPDGPLASLGAIITILALAFEPFMQQLLTYPIRQTLHVSDQTVAE
ncbi:hypothetical protein BJX65DRAFT_302043 [Aspergillus insuetus]